MKNRKGAAFLIVVILSAFILLLAGLFAILGQAYYKNQAENLFRDKALAAAERGINALTSTPHTYSSFTNTEPVIIPGDNQSFYWTKAVQGGEPFYVDGFPDPPNPPYLENCITYYIFKVYSVGVITNGQITNLGTTALEALVENRTSGGITVSSARVISLIVVEKENPDGTLSFVPNNADPPEISPDGLSDLPDGVAVGKALPRKSEWQVTDLTTFLGAS